MLDFSKAINVNQLGCGSRDQYCQIEQKIVVWINFVSAKQSSFCRVVFRLPQVRNCQIYLATRARPLYAAIFPSKYSFISTAPPIKQLCKMD